MRLRREQVAELDLDLLVVGAGPTGVAIGAAARRRGLEVMLVDQGPALASLLQFPTHMQFFTTTDLLEIADIPFNIPEPKPDRRQAVTYYHSVIRAYDIPILTWHRVEAIERGPAATDGFAVELSHEGEHLRVSARKVALAMGYFDFPRRLGIDGEDLPWVHHRYREPYPHFGERVLVVGGGNSAAEAALELWRAGAEVTLVHRGSELKTSVKYWLKPDFENRAEEGAVTALYDTAVEEFEEGGVCRLHRSGAPARIEVDAAYVLIGYEPDMTLFRASGVEVDSKTLVPRVDSRTCESNVEGLYVAGSLQAGEDTNRIFIENSRVHAVRIAEHVATSLAG